MVPFVGERKRERVSREKRHLGISWLGVGLLWASGPWGQEYPSECEHLLPGYKRSNFCLGLGGYSLMGPLLSRVHGTLNLPRNFDFTKIT